jgi:hypothetical protein
LLAMVPASGTLMAVWTISRSKALSTQLQQVG